MRFCDDQLDKTFRFADRQCFAIGRKRKLADFEFQSLIFGGPFRKSDTSDLRLTVGANPGYTFNRLGLLGGEHAIDRLNRFPTRYVRQPGRADDVPGCVVDTTC